MSQTTVEAAFEMLTGDDDGRVCRDIPDSACRELPENFFRHVSSLSLTKTADGLIDPKLVLSWLLTTLGAPAAIIGLLVPIREAGALLPQLFTAASLRRLQKRKWAWVAGSIGQGTAAVCIALAALFLKGMTAGLVILGALSILALSRSVCSVTYKDVLGKTVSKSKRGSATGMAGSVAAVFVILFGALLVLGLIEKMTLVVSAIFLAGALWFVAALVFSTLREEAGATDGGGNAYEAFKDNFTLLKTDAQLRRFILTRGLLTATALAPPFMIALASQSTNASASEAFGGLGLLVIASSAAAISSSYVWGRLADRSSRKVLIFSALAAMIALIATAALSIAGLLGHIAALPISLFALMIAYQGVRLGRSTHLVDMASEDTRAAYTALSNTIIGVLLLAGSIFSVLAATAGVLTVIIIMAAMCALAIVTAIGLEEVQAA
jgi:hypothetical protein